MSNRSTFPLAQLLLLVMLTGLFCAWLPMAVEWNEQQLGWSSQFQTCLLSTDGRVLFCQSGQRGFAAFETISGRRLHSETTTWANDVRFDPDSKRIYVQTDLPEKPQYSLRVIDLSTRQVFVAHSPLPPDNLKLRIRYLFRSGPVTQVFKNDVYDFLCAADVVDDLDVPTHLRCWNLTDGE